MNRKVRIQKRKQIPDRRQKDLQIALRLLPFFHQKSSVGLYLPVRGEADGFELLARLAAGNLKSEDLLSFIRQHPALTTEQLQAIQELSVIAPVVYAPKVLSKTEMAMYPLFKRDLEKNEVYEEVDEKERNCSTQNEWSEKGKEKSAESPVAFYQTERRPASFAPFTPQWIEDLYDLFNVEPGEFGLLEPCPRKGKKPLEVPEVLLIPLLAFCEGYRMGYGGGYYDRYLAAHPQCLRIGIAYDQQEEIFEPQPWDERLDVIVTPTRTLFYGRQERKEDES